MTRRKVFFANDETYHVFNRSVARIPIFRDKSDYERFLKTIDFYRFEENKIKFSRLLSLNKKLKAEYLDLLYYTKEKIEINCFALMPNQYHFMIKQKSDNGISMFISLLQNSYAKYFNLKYERDGSLFLSPFKAVRVESEEQMIHLSRYIHLNPLTSYVLKDNNQLTNYKHNSFSDYISSQPRRFLHTEIVLSYFKNKKSLKNFNLDRVEYQKELKRIEHLLLEV